MTSPSDPIRNAAVPKFRAPNPSPDEITEQALRRRAKALVVSKGWVAGESPSLHSTIELMTAFGMELSKNPESDRCAHPECGCDADAVCASPQPVACPDGWKDIASAPKDGTRVDLWCIEKNEKYAPRRLTDRHYGPMTNWVGETIVGWNIGNPYRDWQPTHWMPRPAPPSFERDAAPRDGEEK